MTAYETGPYSHEGAVRKWDLSVYSDHAFADFWITINALPVGSVIATGFEDEGLIYFEKQSPGFAWKIVQNDDESSDDLPVGLIETTDIAVIDAGGDIQVAYVIKKGPS